MTQQPPTYPRYLERTFSLYRIDQSPGLDYQRHPSGIIVLQLGADHECSSKDITEFSFDTSSKKNGGRDRSKQSVVGKGKKGALKLLPETKICRISCADGSTYFIRSGIKATLIEVNTRLSADPQLLKTSREYSGYIAIMIPPNAAANRLPPEFGAPVHAALEIGSLSESMAKRNNEQKAEDDQPPAKMAKNQTAD